MYPPAHQVPDMSAGALREANQVHRQDPSRPPRQISPRSSHSGTPHWPTTCDNPRRLGRTAEAAGELETAASLAPAEGERRLLLSRLLDVRPEPA